MKALLISDTHGLHKSYDNQFLKNLGHDIDMIIHAGDVSNVGRSNEILEFLDWFSSLDQFKYKIFIAGNHDFGFDTDKYATEAMIPDNVIYLNDSGIEIEGLKFWGSPITPTFYNWAFMKDRGDKIKPYWEAVPSDTDILITHGPPFGILDYVANSHEHVGCRDLFAELDRIRPSYHIFGHIHETYGKFETETCKFYCASVLNGQYRATRMGHIVNLTKSLA